MRLLKLKPTMIKISSKERLHNVNTPIIALTGGIATGKSTVSNLFLEDGACVIDADKLIKNIYNSSEAIEFIKKVEPSCVEPQGINFKKLRIAFFNDQNLKAQIETFLYQKLPGEFQKQIKNDSKFIIYDVPLLYEKGLQTMVDQVVVVYVPKEIQIQRLMNRDKISKELAIKILEQQMDIEEKKSLADHILDNSKDLEFLKKQYQELTKVLFDI